MPFDNRVDFCIMRKETYQSKLGLLLQSAQFLKRESTSDEEISNQLYSKLSSTGGQPARLYSLAWVHKAETPLRPVLSIPGSSYENLTKRLQNFLTISMEPM